MECFRNPYNFGRNRNEVGNLMYVRDDIPTKILNRHRHRDDIQAIEISLRKTKCLICRPNHPPSQNDDYHFHELVKLIDLYSSIYDKFTLIGNFNSEESKS